MSLGAGRKAKNSSDELAFSIIKSSGYDINPKMIKNSLSRLNFLNHLRMIRTFFSSNVCSVCVITSQCRCGVIDVSVNSYMGADLARPSGS